MLDMVWMIFQFLGALVIVAGMLFFGGVIISEMWADFDAANKREAMKARRDAP